VERLIEANNKVRQGLIDRSANLESRLANLNPANKKR
jgi:hypothetical protein